MSDDRRPENRFVPSATMGENAPAPRERPGARTSLLRRPVMVEITPAEATCVNCGQPITFVPAPTGVDPEWSYWFHPSSNQTWCFDPSDPELPLDQRHLRAEPKEGDT